MAALSFKLRILLRKILTICWMCLAVYATYYILKESFLIRLKAIHEYGPIIHEFDPYFNFRATEYLYLHGWKRFVTWFDYKVWYPLGRPVGTTIYPGMQVTAVAIKNFIIKDRMSLNDVCCFIPAWFGSLATFFTGLLAYECSISSCISNNLQQAKKSSFGSLLECIPIVKNIYRQLFLPTFESVFKSSEYFLLKEYRLLQIPSSRRRYADLSSPAIECGLFAAAIMSIVPAHIMRSMGGGFDNESIAVTAMTLTFWLWTRSLRDGIGWLEAVMFGCLTGVAYFYMVAAWGGYVFVINLIGCHVAVLIVLGRYSTKVHRAYTSFYIVGTFLAICVPVVGLTPLKSLEQLGPCAIFLVCQILVITEWLRIRYNIYGWKAWRLRVISYTTFLTVLITIVFFLASTGYFGPISARVRGLFVKHTKTGNPLVDSVAEHQPASRMSYFHYLNVACYLAPIGFAMVTFRFFHDSSSFLLVYGLAAYFFSHKMVRLILLTAPIASSLGGIALGRVFGWFIYNILGFSPALLDEIFNYTSNNVEEKKKDTKITSPNKTKINETSKSLSFFCKFLLSKSLVIIGMIYATTKLVDGGKKFHESSHEMAHAMSYPSIVFKGKLRSGESILVDDYRETYFWIRDNTPEDSRILAWWDYGYQITAMANRTTVADGNTWNHEHIALLGRILTSSEKEGHRIARHLADYVLIWAGGGGDDLAKSPHLARIANSVYRHMCPGDPTCSRFGISEHGHPSPMMRESLLFNLHSHRLQSGVEADPNRFREVYQSKYGKVRVFKIMSVSLESKRWVADRQNLLCDHNESWFCRGQYPPSLNKILAEKRDFSQLEDFNKDIDDSEYQKQYFENLNMKMVKRDQSLRSDESKIRSKQPKKPWKPNREVRPLEIADLSSKWEDSEITSNIRRMISHNKVKDLMEWLKENPEIGFMRSSDGRGPMWWAYESDNDKIVRILKKVGVSDKDTDRNGLTPSDLMKISRQL